MSEEEYVHTIKVAARDYLDVLSGGHPDEVGALHAAKHWQSTKENLSPLTVIAMCDAWLQANVEDPVDDGVEIDESPDAFIKAAG